MEALLDEEPLHQGVDVGDPHGEPVDLGARVLRVGRRVGGAGDLERALQQIRLPRRDQGEEPLHGRPARRVVVHAAHPAPAGAGPPGGQGSGRGGQAGAATVPLPRVQVSAPCSKFC